MRKSQPVAAPAATLGSGKGVRDARRAPTVSSAGTARIGQGRATLAIFVERLAGGASSIVEPSRRQAADTGDLQQLASGRR